MSRLFMVLSFYLVLGAAHLSPKVFAQEANYRPELFFREDWALQPQQSEHPLTQKHVMNPDLLLNVYGESTDSLSKSHHDQPIDDPHYVWSGLTTSTWMVSLKHKTHNVDLSEFAKIKWRTKQAGFRRLHITLKLADGTWLISDFSEGSSADWRISEINLADITWHELDTDMLAEKRPVEHPDLSNVEEIGFTDLMRGGRSLACSRLDWIEVYGRPIER